MIREQDVDASARRLRLPRHAAVGTTVAGLALLGGTIGYLGTSPVLASVLAVLISLGLGTWLAAKRLVAWRVARIEGRSEA